jgi:ribonuclease G
VNSGKNLKKSDSFFLELNKEAAREAYRQIRLRNLTGMILIDFISMKSSEMNEEFTEFIKDLISTDNLNMRFIDLTGLGIMEFTRDKKYKSLSETIDFKDL